MKMNISIYTYKKSITLFVYFKKNINKLCEVKLNKLKAHGFFLIVYS